MKIWARDNTVSGLYYFETELMKEKLALLIFPILVVAAGCGDEMKDVSSEVTKQELSLETKAVNSPIGSLPDEILVKFARVPSDADLSKLSELGFTKVERIFNSVKGKEDLERKHGLDRWYKVGVPEGSSREESSMSIAGLESVAAIEYEHVAQKASDCVVYPYEGQSIATRAGSNAIFNDPSLPDQWNYNNRGDATIATYVAQGADINVNDVWSKLTCGDPEIIVAVVDEPVKYTHPDLAANMWTNPGEIAGNGKDDDGNGYVDDIHGYNFVAKGALDWSKDGNSGHGTHTAGTVAAVNNNGIGVAGVAGGSGKGDGCKIMSCQIFDGEYGGSASITARAIKYAGDNGASVISCSFGYTSSFSSDDNYLGQVGTLESDAIHYFEDCKNNSVIDGGIAVFAAGNEGHNYAHYPGALHDIISVSAFAPDFLPTYYTNYGPGCNIAAPGGEAYLPPFKDYRAMVLSTTISEAGGSDYGYMQGTSMACPHVSGIVALGLSYAKKQGKTFTRDEFKNMLLSATDDIDNHIATSTKRYYNNAQNINLGSYYHQMGTGAADAWRLMMQIDGTPCITAQLGKTQWLDISSFFGSSSVSLTYLDVTVPQATVNSLGLQEIQGADATGQAAVPASGYAYVQFGRLYIHPTKIGAGTITIKAVGGGSSVGGGNNPPGGMELIQTISVIVRDVDGGNGKGGWL